ncbi:MAG: hypothetical protein ORO03_09555, partial [Alphaproteobacteria bacterium]|nr:hypothetical protein [Alphaproteobacteria bacterium]
AKSKKIVGLLRRLTATAFALLRHWRGAKPRGDEIVANFLEHFHPYQNRLLQSDVLRSASEPACFLT